MLTIRAAQVAALRQSALLRFDEGMVNHVKSFAPWHRDAPDDAYLHEAVRYGRERASLHRFTLRGPVQFYIELMCFLGAGFDSDPQYPWATRILQDQSDDEFLRADRLHVRAIAYLEKVAGPKNRYANAALRRMKSMGLDLVTPFETSALDGMRRLYPEKCEFVGQPALEALMEEGTRLATAYDAAEPADHGFCAGMMFVLGHGCASDPLLPWVRELLSEAPSRFTALRTRLASYLEAISRSTEGA